MAIAVCPGSFDPLTNGHVDVIRRAAAIFETVIVVIAHNQNKTGTFTAPERVELAREALADIPNVEVTSTTGLLVDLCKERGATSIVKGLRSAADFDAEYSMALLNRHLGSVETVFVLGDQNLSHIASSFVKDVAAHGGSVAGLVPACVEEALKARFSPCTRA